MSYYNDKEAQLKGTYTPITFEQPFDGLRGSTIRNQFWNIVRGIGAQRQALEDQAIQIYNKRKQEKANNYWLNRAKQFGFNSIEDVIAWQKERGLVADGKFGSKSEAEFNRMENLKTVPDNFTPKDTTPFINTNPNIDYSKYKLQLKKQGGTMTKYQQGGAAPQQNNLQQQIIQLVQAAAGGDQQATQQIEQILQAAQKGDQQAMQIAQMIQQVVEAMKQQKVAAKYGTKLSYIKRLKGECPEGEEKVYLKSGGCMCQKKVEKASDGTKTKKKEDLIKSWKKDREKYKNDEAARDSVAINKYNDQETMVNKGNKGSIKKGVWTPDRSKYKTEKKACGGKTLKSKK